MDKSLKNREKVKGVIGSGDCWLIQMKGFEACSDCEFKNTDSCGGGQVLLYKIATEIGGTSILANGFWQEEYIANKEDKSIVEVTHDIIKSNRSGFEELAVSQIKTAWNSYLFKTRKEQNQDWKLYESDDPFIYNGHYYRFTEGFWEIIEIEGTDYMESSGILENNEYMSAILVSEGLLDIDTILDELDNVISSMWSEKMKEDKEKGYYTREYIEKNPTSDEVLFLVFESFQYGLGRAGSELYKFIVPENIPDEEKEDYKEEIESLVSPEDWFKENYGFDPEELE